MEAFATNELATKNPAESGPRICNRFFFFFEREKKEEDINLQPCLMDYEFFFFFLRRNSYSTNGIFGRDLYKQKDDRENFEGENLVSKVWINFSEERLRSDRIGLVAMGQIITSRIN